MFNVRHEQTPLEGVLVVKFDRYGDDRGYFTETLRVSDLPFIPNLSIVQANESLSVGNTIRGLHFQWNPFMGKLVRVLVGEFYDLAVDIRKGSPTFGKGIIIKFTRDLDSRSDRMAWLPPGIAHGFFCQDTCVIEYLCTGEYSGSTESAISPLAQDIDWSLSDPVFFQKFKDMQFSAVITDKDRNAHTLNSWLANEDSENFVYDEDLI